ncbi:MULTISPECIES: MerR family transcriptional regulator [unclassified Flavobacterium]|uniref:MerR family transcriptional regulator n=1 Tax=unclassified Flavobacterium TaxID=196869 RepID=UPI0012929CB3|nr:MULTISPECIES: MerR family transcriptional regulator [unclassified Flavobacterium]MQP52486.1 MerR family transcriptional regulator [Flavobacterium sp. LMO9]MQP62556.1 MerR family transcriptional regulator [Flavobacterium sp. LMO6]
MNNVKNVFSIKDLENLSGIKAHTIRIWEKRYNVLEPMRSDTNIRSYDIKNLQKLLNIVLLHNYGYKISKIATLDQAQINKLSNDIISEKSAKNHAISTFKMAMMNFDQSLFFNTYNELLNEKTFKEVFYTVFIPLMQELGFLWQTETISPSHEHFITYLIKQKLLINTEKVQVLEPTKNDKVFVLFLPLNEIHELGLMYLNYEILLNGYQTIYLGESIPTNSLVDLKNSFEKITFVSYLTVEPNQEEINDYIVDMQTKLLDNTNHELLLLGRMTQFITTKELSKNIHLFSSIEELANTL